MWAGNKTENKQNQLESVYFEIDEKNYQPGICLFSQIMFISRNWTETVLCLRFITKSNKIEHTEKTLQWTVDADGKIWMLPQYSKCLRHLNTLRHFAVSSQSNPIKWRHWSDSSDKSTKFFISILICFLKLNCIFIIALGMCAQNNQNKIL